MVFEAIRKNTAPEMVVEQILHRISTGELAPGTQLPSQRDLAVSFGVGRSSIREALNALVVMGYLDVQHGRGTFVTSELPGSDPSLSKLKAALRAGSLIDLIELRETIESKAAELAAERAESRHLDLLKQALREMEASRDDYNRFFEADLEFHTVLAEASANEILSEMLRFLLGKVVDHHEGLKTRLLSAEYRAHSIHTLGQVLECLRKDDGPGAARWIQDHLNAIRRELRDIL